MAGICEGRIVIVTGAGRGIGRKHALEFGRQGAKVVVNDLGGAGDGGGSDATVAEEVAAEVRADGGEAVANGDDAADWEGAQRLINQAIEEYGALDVLVNNAGILRDRVLVNMTQEEWQRVVDVTLGSAFAPTRFAGAYWRAESKAGNPRDARVVNTTSASGIFANAGQTNYGAAKAGVATFSLIAAKELGRYGVNVNCIAPGAKTRLTESLLPEAMAADVSFDAAQVSPLVVWLGSPESKDITGRVFEVNGRSISVCEGWTRGPRAKSDDGWVTEDLGKLIPDLVADAAPPENIAG